MPPHTIVRPGVPPFEPASGQAAHIRAWIRRATQLAGPSQDKVHTGDLWLSIAMAQEHIETDPAFAKTLRALEAARRAYPPTHPGVTSAWLQAARLHIGRGDPAGASRAIEALDRVRPAPDPVRTPQDLARYEAVLRARARRLPGLRADAQAMRGALAEAAVGLQTAAQEAPAWVAPERRASWLRRAAAFYVRAGQHDEAIGVADRALQRAEGKALADWMLWRLCAAHGALDTRGELSVRAPWPGEGFVDAAQAHCEAHGHVQGASTHSLFLASMAVSAEDIESALRLYEIAFDQPALLRRARREPAIHGGLAAGISEAIGAGALLQARTWLEALARQSQDDDSLLRDLRVALQQAELEASGADPSDASAEPDEARTVKPAVHRVRMRPAPAAPPTSPAEDASPPTSPPPASRTVPGWVAALGLLVLTCMLWRVVRRWR